MSSPGFAASEPLCASLSNGGAALCLCPNGGCGFRRCTSDSRESTAMTRSGTSHARSHHSTEGFWAFPRSSAVGVSASGSARGMRYPKNAMSDPTNISPNPVSRHGCQIGEHATHGSQREPGEAGLRAKAHESLVARKSHHDDHGSERQDAAEDGMRRVERLALRWEPLIRSPYRNQGQTRDTERELNADADHHDDPHRVAETTRHPGDPSTAFTNGWRAEGWWRRSAGASGRWRGGRRPPPRRRSWPRGQRLGARRESARGRRRSHR